MELKTNYQYTYFVYPFIKKEERYQNYIRKLLRDKNCKIKIFQKEKDLGMYKYFLPKAKEFLFSSFSFSNEKIKKLEELPIETRAALLAEYNCNIFEYELKKDIQGKVDGKEGIFFHIQKIEIICFKAGICFLFIKTNIEEDSNFSNVLNFNYKFRDINQELSALDSYDNIRLQTDSFSDVEFFKDFVSRITGVNTYAEAAKLNMDNERFLTYSYACIDHEAWNSVNSFDAIKSYYMKYVNILPADNSREFEESKMTTLAKWKYAKLGLTKSGMMMFSSSTDMNNYTILPDEYEKQYFYTYILSLYKKIYLKKLSLEFKNQTKMHKTRKKFIEFTRKIWIQEITEDVIGTSINNNLQEVFELEKAYSEVKNKYDILYKEMNIERKFKVSWILGLALMRKLRP